MCTRSLYKVGMQLQRVSNSITLTCPQLIVFCYSRVLFMFEVNFMDFTPL